MYKRCLRCGYYTENLDISVCPDCVMIISFVTEYPTPIARPDVVRRMREYCGEHGIARDWTIYGPLLEPGELECKTCASRKGVRCKLVGERKIPAHSLPRPTWCPLKK